MTETNSLTPSTSQAKPVASPSSTPPAISQGRAEGFPGRGGAGHFVAREQAEQTGKRLHEFGHGQTHGHKNNVDARKGIGKRLAESLEHRLDTVHHAGNRGLKPHQSGGLDLRGQFAPDFSRCRP